MFWLSAPKRGEWLQTMIDVGANGVTPHSVVWVGLGFMKAYRVLPPNCRLLVEPTWALAVVVENGWAHKHLFVIPSDPALKGLPLFAQAAHMGWRGLAFSRGIQMSVR